MASHLTKKFYDLIQGSGTNVIAMPRGHGKTTATKEMKEASLVWGSAESAIDDIRIQLTAYDANLQSLKSTRTALKIQPTASSNSTYTSNTGGYTIKPTMAEERTYFMGGPLEGQWRNIPPVDIHNEVDGTGVYSYGFTSKVRDSKGYYRVMLFGNRTP
jgi:hypothetical protein